MKKELKYLDNTATVEIRNADEHIQKHWVLGQFYETQRNGMLNYIYANEPKGGKFIDIGASIGNHSIFFHKIMEASVVISFEPHPDSFDHLRENIKANNPNASILLNVALGEKNGHCIMNAHSSDNVGMMQVQESAQGEILIQPLDNYFEDVQGYDVIKIDVEHYNEELLKGAERTLTEGTGTVYIEAESPEELILVDKYMTEYNYKRVEGIVLNHTPTYIYKKIQ